MKQLYKNQFRAMIILALMLMQNLLPVKAQDMFLTAIPTSSSLVSSIPEDTRIIPAKAIASASQSGEGIGRTSDRLMNTLWHSPYNTTTFPISLTYLFVTPQIDYVVYYPRTSGDNGNFKEVEVWYSLKGDDQPMKLNGSYDFGGSASPSIVKFSPALINPDTIVFVVKSGANNFASCAEMEFYCRAAGSFKSEDIFTDASCSQLKPGITKNDIQGISSEFYRKLASDILNNDYDREGFRVQQYQAYRTPKAWATENKTAQFGIFDGPTGLYAKKGETIVLMMSEPSGMGPSLTIKQDTSINRTNYALKTGVNKITASHDGLMYISYYTVSGAESPVTINIVTGHVTGYYDKRKHTAAGDWERLINAATYPFFDLKGDYSTINGSTAILKAQATTARGGGKALIDLYDDVIYRELEFEGFVKYNRMPPTRLHFQVSPGGNPNASDYRVYMPWDSQAGDFNPSATSGGLLQETSGHTGGTAWMLAHEAGHVLQVRPGLKWINMTEVTNNICSQLVTIAWGLQSRLMYEKVSGSNNRYKTALSSIVNNASLVNFVADTDPFRRLVPFWQLKLYMHDVRGDNDFYKRIYEKIRTNPNPTGRNGCSVDAICQMEFFKIVCQESGYDFTQFFESWKFFKPCNVQIEDYSTSTFVLTEAVANEYKAAVAAMGLPEPPLPTGKVLYNLDDANVNDYKK